MPRRSTTLFKRNDLRRALRSAQESGLSVDSFEIGKDGKIVIHTGKGESAGGGNEPESPLERWKASRGQG